jgi:hypothetical protein
MPITRKMVAQDDNQWLKLDHATRYVTNDMDDWQYLFGPNSSLSASSQVIKLGAKFDDLSFNKIKIVGYLYDQKNGSISAGATCELKIYKVSTTTWEDVLVTTLTGVLQPNNYFYVEPTLTSLNQFDFSGGDTMMIEGTIMRLGIPYRDRIYVNHLGIFDSLTRLKNKVAFLEVTKLDE